MQNSPSSRVVLLDQTLELTPRDTRTHKVFEFSVPEGVESLVIQASYTPKIYRDRAKSLELALQSVERYDLDRNAVYGKPVEKLPHLLNLVILSVDMNGRYMGAAHRHARKQQIIISSEEAAPGFHACPIEPGIWRIVVSVFLVLTERCIYKLRVAGTVKQTQKGEGER